MDIDCQHMPAPGGDIRDDIEPVYAVMDGIVGTAGYEQNSGFYIRLIHSPFFTTSFKSTSPDVN
jgi:hypothetical protein